MAQNYSEQIYNGIISYYNEIKHYGFIESEDGNSYYFFVDIRQLKQKIIELRRQNSNEIIKYKFCSGDEVQFKIKKSNDKIEVYAVEYIRNVRKQLLINEADKNQILFGYLKQINDDKFFVKHISTYVFVPIKISNYEIDIDEVYTQRLNKLVQFKLTQTKKIEKLSAILVDRKFSDEYKILKKHYQSGIPLLAKITGRNTKGLFATVMDKYKGFITLPKESTIEDNERFQAIKRWSEVLVILKYSPGDHSTNLQLQLVY
ncbi:MAG: hypothetical protein LBR10_11180 [Prevotellaceae bacterium]|jgi:cold shock CspA family protein|nr:hypothetical protein [Prevotellaceae bacterium]